MSTADPVPVQPLVVPPEQVEGFARRPRRRRLLGVTLLVALLAAGAAWYKWQQRNHLDPPSINSVGVDPEVVAAVEAARQAVRRDPHSAAAWGHLGKVLLVHVFEEEAERCFEQAEKLDSRDPQWAYFRGLNRIRQHPNEGIACLQRAIQLQGTVPAMRLRLADALLAQERPNEAKVEYHQVLGKEPGNPRAQLGLARLLFRRGSVGESRGYVTAVLGNPYTHKAAHVLLAEIEQQDGNNSEAARLGLAASKLPNDPSWPDPISDKIMELMTGKRARLRLALHWFESGQIQQARSILTELQREYPEWDQAWLHYGRVLFEEQEYAAAAVALRQSLGLAPNSVQAHFYLGLVLTEQGDDAGAAEQFHEATRLKPDYARAYFNLGQCLKRQGQMDQALEAFARAGRLKPSYAAAFAESGALRAQQGDRAEAMRDLVLAVELNPDDEASRRLLEQLRQKK
jgi:tetratricopeptide (TPR) repeat protein